MAELFIIPALALHLLAVNVGSAGPLVVAWLLQRDDAERRALARRLARYSMAALLVGLALGGALLLAPLPGLRAALARFPAKEYWFGGFELLFSVACVGLLIRVAHSQRRRPAVAWILALLTSSNLLYHFPPLMIVLGELAVDPAWAAGDQLERRAILRLWIRPEVAALWAHFALASLAAAPLAALWLQRDEKNDQLEATTALNRRLAAAALIASLLQLPVGAWVLLASDGSTRDSLMGGSLLASGFFIAGVFTALGLLQTLAHIALGDDRAAIRRKSAVMFALVALLMTATLRTSRMPTRNAAAPEAPPHVAHLK